MSKKIFSKFLLFLSTIVFSQEKLVINYTFKYEFDISKSNDLKMIETYKESNKGVGDYLLITSKDESIFNRIEKINNNQNHSQVNKIEIPSANLYINYNHNYVLDNFDFRGKKILVKDSLATYDWLILKEYDKILGYNVRKAIAKKDNRTYEAWYAQNLPIKSGPESYWGLPGIILKVEISMNQDDGVHKRSYTATEIKLDNDAIIIKPSKGKIFSKQEFENYFNELFKVENEIENNKVTTNID